MAIDNVAKCELSCCEDHSLGDQNSNFNRIFFFIYNIFIYLSLRKNNRDDHKLTLRYNYYLLKSYLHYQSAHCLPPLKFM